mgnify:CR=1 FL=1
MIRIQFTNITKALRSSRETHWDIAESTMTSEYDSVQEYVQVLKEMNNLDSDDIQAGQYLMIAYNDTEFLP